MADMFNGGLSLAFAEGTDQWVAVREVLNSIQRTSRLEAVPRGWSMDLRATTDDNRTVIADSLAEAQGAFDAHHMKVADITLAMSPRVVEGHAIGSIILSSRFHEVGTQTYNNVDLSIYGDDRILLESFITELREDFDAAFIVMLPGTVVQVRKTLSQSTMVVRSAELTPSADEVSTEMSEPAPAPITKPSPFREWLKETSSKVLVTVLGAVLVAVILGILKSFGIILS